MGYARSRRDKRDLSKHETLYQDPDYERLRGPDARGAARRDRRTEGVLASGTTIETLFGLVALVVTIIGFGYLPVVMGGIAAIAIGVALFSQGIAIMSRWREALRRFDGARLDKHELAGGVSVEVFAGVVGVVLGILVLADVRPLVLVPAAATVFGGALLLGGAAQPDLVHLTPGRSARQARATYDAIQASGGIMVLVGVAAAVLGILGLLAVGPIITLSLVAFLAIGGALVFAGGALTARLLHRFT